MNGDEEQRLFVPQALQKVAASLNLAGTSNGVLQVLNLDRTPDVLSPTSRTGMVHRATVDAPGGTAAPMWDLKPLEGPVTSVAWEGDFCVVAGAADGKLCFFK